MILDEYVACSECGHMKPYPDTDADAAWTHAADGGEYMESRPPLKRLSWDEPAPGDLFDGEEFA